MSRLQTPIRRNDTVIVVTGKDNGKKGRVLKVLPEKNRLIVEGINIIKRHTRPNPQNSQNNLALRVPRAPRENFLMSRLATPLRKNDNVLVITGKDRGKRGRVLKVVPGETGKTRLIVEGVNMIKRHTKPNPGKNIKGGIVEREASLHASNVQLVCPECGAQTRIGHKMLGDGRKVRICRKCEGVVDK